MWKSEPIWSAVSYYPIFLLAGNISRSTLLSSQFEHNISPQHICLADLVSGASIFSAGIFKSNSTDIMERRTRFLPTGWSPDYSSHTHKREWNAFQTVHLEGSIKCSTSLLLCAAKCDDCTCECIYFFYTLKRRANLGGKSDPSEQACCFFCLLGILELEVFFCWLFACFHCNIWRPSGSDSFNVKGSPPPPDSPGLTVL